MPTSKPKVAITVLTTYERNGWVSPELAEFLVSTRYSKYYDIVVAFANNYVPAAAGRNEVCATFLSSEADWLCMIDNDMKPPANLLDCIKEPPEDASVVIPRFYMWDQSRCQLKLCWKFPKNSQDTRSLEPGFQEIVGGGTGTIFIRRKDFLTMPMPWFAYKYNKMQGMEGTEDLVFCDKAREMGLKIYGNADFVVGHYRSVDLASMSNTWFMGVQALKDYDSAKKDLTPEIVKA